MDRRPGHPQSKTPLYVFLEYESLGKYYLRRYMRGGKEEKYFNGGGYLAGAFLPSVGGGDRQIHDLPRKKKAGRLSRTILVVGARGWALLSVVVVVVDSSRLSESAGKSSIMRVKSSVRLGSPRVTIGNVSVVDIFFT